MTKEIITKVILGAVGTTALVSGGVGVTNSIQESKNDNSSLKEQLEIIRADNNSIRAELEKVKKENENMKKEKEESKKVVEPIEEVKQEVIEPVPAPIVIPQESEWEKMEKIIKTGVNNGKAKYTQIPMAGETKVYFYFDNKPRQYALCYEHTTASKVFCHLASNPHSLKVAVNMVDKQVIIDKLN